MEVVERFLLMVGEVEVAGNEYLLLLMRTLTHQLEFLC